MWGWQPLLGSLKVKRTTWSHDGQYLSSFSHSGDAFQNRLVVDSNCYFAEYGRAAIFRLFNASVRKRFLPLTKKHIKNGYWAADNADLESHSLIIQRFYNAIKE